MKFVSEKMEVTQKITREKDGKTYYNIKSAYIGGSDLVGVSQDIYEAVDEGDVVQFEGVCYFRDKQRVWFITGLHA